MQALLTNAIVATVALTATVMMLDFILGLVHLAKSSQPPQLPQARVEDVFKIIDSPQTENALQFSTVGSQATDYEAMSIRELKGLASSLKIPYYSRKRKAELIEAIRNA